MEITSIGWLNRADGGITLTPCIDGNMHPTKVQVTLEEFRATNKDKGAMAALALDKLK